MHADITSWFVSPRAAFTTSVPQRCDGMSQMAAKRSRKICVCLLRFILYDHWFPAKGSLGWPWSRTHSMKSALALPVFMPSETRMCSPCSSTDVHMCGCTHWKHAHAVLFLVFPFVTLSLSLFLSPLFLFHKGALKNSSRERVYHASVKLLCRHKHTELQRHWQTNWIETGIEKYMH